MKLLATGWTVRGSNPGGGEILLCPPDWRRCSSTLLYNGYRVFHGVKRPERGADYPPLSFAGLRFCWNCTAAASSVPA